MRKSVGRTHIGKVRVKNQDTIFTRNEKNGNIDALFIVADGMGGHKAGEVASGKAVEFFCSYIAQTPLLESSMAAYLKEGVLYANAKVYNLAVENAEWGGMGTTFSAIAFAGGLAYFVHVGDSRIYIYSPGGLKQLSDDHSYVAEMVRLGKLTEEEARVHPKKNVLTRALGTDIAVEVDSGTFSLPPDSGLLLCSDGLSNMVTDTEICAILNKEATPDEKADALVELALENGGRDNISLIIVSPEDV